MGAQHTSGPWAEPYEDSLYRVPFLVIETDQPAGPDLHTICEVSARYNDAADKFQITDEVRATAHLIRAAPELLAALELALPRLAHKHSCLSCRPIQEWEEFGSASFENCDCEIKVVRAAISRALPGGEGK